MRGHYNPVHTWILLHFFIQIAVIAYVSITAASPGLQWLYFRTSSVKYALITYDKLAQKTMLHSKAS